MSEVKPRECAGPCRWEVLQSRDMYGIRTLQQRCSTCGRERIRSIESPTTLGDHHRRMD